MNSLLLITSDRWQSFQKAHLQPELELGTCSGRKLHYFLGWHKLQICHRRFVTSYLLHLTKSKYSECLFPFHLPISVKNWLWLLHQAFGVDQKKINSVCCLNFFQTSGKFLASQSITGVVICLSIVKIVSNCTQNIQSICKLPLWHHVLFGGFLWSLINVNLHLTTDNKIGLDTTSIYSKLPDFT